MADQPPQYPSATPPAFPPAPSAPPQYAAQQPYVSAPPYAPLPPQYAPTQAVPVRRGRGGSGAMVWLLGGCGLIAVLLLVLSAVAVKNLFNTDLVKNQSSIPTASRNLVEIRLALDQYTRQHNGKFPASLEGVVDPSYLSYQSSSTGETIKAVYTPPAPNAPDDTPIAGFYVGQFSMNVGQMVTQRTYLRLLKDRTIVQEQITRTPLPNQ
jgi:hypothetical protein